MEFPRCQVCTNFYSEERLPMVLPCGHTLCHICINLLFEANAVVECPYKDWRVYDLKQIKVNRELSKFEHAKCTKHSKTVQNYCTTHALALCDQCDHGESTCNVLDWNTEIFVIHNDLVGKVEQFSSQLDSAPLPRTMKIIYDERSRQSNVKLLDLLQKLRSLTLAVRCVSCGDFATQIDTASLSGYCSNCCMNIKKKTLDVDQDDQMKVILVPSVDDSEAIQRLIALARSYMPQINFHYLTSRHYQGLRHPSPSVKEVLSLVKEINSFLHQRKLENSELPDMLACPKCERDFRKQDFSMEVLQCKAAFHAVCGSCFANQETFTCPFDGHTFLIRKNEARQHPVQPVAPAIPVPSLTNSGIPVPVFAASQGISFVQKFMRLFPIENILSVPKQIQHLCQGWPVVFRDQREQVEAMAFVVFVPVEIIGFSICNPIKLGELVEIEWIKLYSGFHSTGDPSEVTTTTPKVLEGNGHCLTDVFLRNRLRIREGIGQSIKLKWKRLNQSADKVMLYSGNHESRPPNTEGSDGIVWLFEELYGVDSTEVSSFQLNLTGPIIRILYRTLS